MAVLLISCDTIIIYLSPEHRSPCPSSCDPSLMPMPREPHAKFELIPSPSLDKEALSSIFTEASPHTGPNATPLSVFCSF